MKISQREARQLRKRVQQLEQRESNRRKAWAQQWFGGVNICTATWEPDAKVPVAIRTARALRHAVVVLLDGDNSGTVRFMALPLPESDL